MQIRVDGMEELFTKLRRIGDEAESVLEEALDEAAKPIQSDASQRAPVKTGLLASEIVREMDRGGKSIKVGPSKKAWYGIFPEIGTRFQAAQPYLRLAMDSRRGDAQNGFAAVLVRGIKRAAR